jgi:hypothetical protein
MALVVQCAADEDLAMQLEQTTPDRHELAYFERQARTLRLESNRASPTLSRQFLALAELYECRIAALAAAIAEHPAS